MSEALKPCPFCGCSLEDFGHTRENGKTVMSYIHPDSDCALSRLVFTGKKWNRRTPATLPTVEELRELFWRQEGVHLNLHHAIFLAALTQEYLTLQMGGES